jgi:hypothetical protein
MGFQVAREGEIKQRIQLLRLAKEAPHDCRSARMISAGSADRAACLAVRPELRRQAVRIAVACGVSHRSPARSTAQSDQLQIGDRAPLPAPGRDGYVQCSADTFDVVQINGFTSGSERVAFFAHDALDLSAAIKATFPTRGGRSGC